MFGQPICVLLLIAKERVGIFFISGERRQLPHSFGSFGVYIVRENYIRWVSKRAGKMAISALKTSGSLESG